MYVYKLAVCLCWLMVAQGLSEGRLKRRRREVCEHGTYEHEGKTCCMCQSGYRVLSDCKNDNEGNCVRCKLGSFTSHANSYHSCWPCKICDPSANMEIKETCSLYSNTICQCQKDHYCDKGDHCRACYPCDTCEEHGGVKIACTLTNNTVCNGDKGSTGTYVAAFLLTLVVFIVALMVILWRKKKFCFNYRQKKEQQPPEEQVPLEREKLPDVDMTPYLHEIASILKSKWMKDVARRTGMSEKEIDEQKLNYPNDVKEQTYRLLQEWSQAQGLYKGYRNLIYTLQDLKNKTAADQIRQIVEKERLQQGLYY